MKENMMLKNERKHDVKKMKENMMLKNEGKQYRKTRKAKVCVGKEQEPGSGGMDEKII